MAVPFLAIAQVAGSVLSGIGTAIEGLNRGELLEQRGEAMRQYYADQARATKITSSRKATAELQAGIVSGAARGATSLEAAYSNAFDINLTAAFQRAQLRQQGRMAEFDQLMQAQTARYEGATKGIGKVSGLIGGKIGTPGVKK